MKKLLFVLAALILTIGAVSAQDLNAPINPDPNVKIGKLDNGMTYYIRANKKPENRVEFRLAVNAGSCQENEDQRGLAHFTEHMAFNGIKGYPNNTMISELQKIGVTFGIGINAYTSFDETVYELTMPNDKPEYIQMGLDILNGWANGLLYDSKEIESERGVIAKRLLQRKLLNGLRQIKQLLRQQLLHLTEQQSLLRSVRKQMRMLFSLVFLKI